MKIKTNPQTATETGSGWENTLTLNNTTSTTTQRHSTENAKPDAGLLFDSFKGDTVNLRAKAVPTWLTQH